MSNFIARAAQAVKYDPETGEFWRLGGRRAGERADVAAANGYRRVYVCGRPIPAHRLAWMLMTGAEPTGLVDHRNRDRSDNRWLNLRDVPHVVNAHNTDLPATNTTGYKGVQFTGTSWKGVLKVNRRYFVKRGFDTAEDAAKWVEETRERELRNLGAT